jgi:hypothetical protein
LRKRIGVGCIAERQWWLPVEQIVHADDEGRPVGNVD